MNRTQLENLYRINGLSDFKLKEPKDLLRVHGIDPWAVDGYAGLDDENRAIYEEFILNIFNATGLDSRASLIPTAIYLVEDIEYLVKENPKQDYYDVAGGIVLSVDRNGEKTLLHQWEDEDYKHLERIVEKPKTYLRFEYQSGVDSNGDPHKVWLHVTNKGKSWY